ncbi:MAG TPA: helix-hairpin-helix domain-containing protein [Phycisphaerae bacterium]|nr:helix-hairpin-helix domain-containing protein [Phycisphaerae bacterium]
MNAYPSGELQSIPGIGPRLARDLRDLGFASVVELRDADPQRMYENLCRLRGTRVDRCVLYVFRCAVYYASRRRHEPRLLQWWHWKDRVSARRRT